MHKRVVSLSLNAREMEVLEQLAERQGLTKVGVLRQALRTYQCLDERANQELKLLPEDPLTNEEIERHMLSV